MPSRVERHRATNGKACPAERRNCARRGTQRPDHPGLKSIRIRACHEKNACATLSTSGTLADRCGPGQCRMPSAVCQPHQSLVRTADGSPAVLAPDLCVGRPGSRRPCGFLPVAHCPQERVSRSIPPMQPTVFAPKRRTRWFASRRVRRAQFEWLAERSRQVRGRMLRGARVFASRSTGSICRAVWTT